MRVMRMKMTADGTYAEQNRCKYDEQVLASACCVSLLASDCHDAAEHVTAPVMGFET
jgi:hypothetical protein